MEYDPEGGDYKPVTEHETGSTFMVLGLIMLIAAGGWLLFVRWDIRAGGGLMQGLFATDVVIAFVLLVLGFIKKKRQTN
jgi:multisubunit Na+/H+ antiporter MnhB subunit